MFVFNEGRQIQSSVPCVYKGLVFIGTPSPEGHSGRTMSRAFGSGRICFLCRFPRRRVPLAWLRPTRLPSKLGAEGGCSVWKSRGAIDTRGLLGRLRYVVLPEPEVNLP